jgi:hypothetical protein
VASNLAAVLSPPTEFAPPAYVNEPLVPRPKVQPVGGAEIDGVEKFHDVGNNACACDAIATAQKPKLSKIFLNIILPFKKLGNVKLLLLIK